MNSVSAGFIIGQGTGENFGSLYHAEAKELTGRVEFRHQGCRASRLFLLQSRDASVLR